MIRWFDLSYPLCTGWLGRTPPYARSLSLSYAAIWKLPECFLIALPSLLHYQPHKIQGIKKTPSATASILLFQTRGRGLYPSSYTLENCWPCLKFAVTGVLPWTLLDPLKPHSIRQPFLMYIVFQGHPSFTDGISRVFFLLILLIALVWFPRGKRRDTIFFYYFKKISLNFFFFLISTQKLEEVQN